MIKRITLHIDCQEDGNPIDYMKGPEYKRKIDELYDECLRKVRKYNQLDNYDKELTEEQCQVLDILIDNVMAYLSEE